MHFSRGNAIHIDLNIHKFGNGEFVTQVFPLVQTPSLSITFHSQSRFETSRLVFSQMQHRLYKCYAFKKPRNIAIWVYF